MDAGEIRDRLLVRLAKTMLTRSMMRPRAVAIIDDIGDLLLKHQLIFYILHKYRFRIVSENSSSAAIGLVDLGWVEWLIGRAEEMNTGIDRPYNLTSLRAALPQNPN